MPINFVTAHTFCASRDGPKTEIFSSGFQLYGRSKFLQGLLRSEKKLGVTTHLSYIVLYFGALFKTSNINHRLKRAVVHANLFVED